jgi:putative transposase
MKFRDPKSGKTFVRKVRRVSDEPGHAYELSFSCFHRFRLLEKDRARQWFVEAMTEARSRLKFDLWADVIMPEHVHLIVYPGESGASAGQVRSKIKELAARPAFWSSAKASFSDDFHRQTFDVTMSSCLSDSL